MRRGYSMGMAMAMGLVYIYRVEVLVACLESRVASSWWRYIKELLLTAPSSGVEDKCVDGRGRHKLLKAQSERYMTSSRCNHTHTG